MANLSAKRFKGGEGLHTGHGKPDLLTLLRDAFTDLANLHAATPGGAALGLGGKGYLYSGGLVTNPTTPSSQLTGAGNTTWNVDVSAADARVNSVDDSVAASADEAIHSGSNLLSAVGKACYAYIVLAESGGAVAIASVKGAADDAASAVLPTDAEITTGVGHDNWIKLAECYIERTADTTVVQTQNNVGQGAAAVALLSVNV